MHFLFLLKSLIFFLLIPCLIFGVEDSNLFAMGHVAQDDNLLDSQIKKNDKKSVQSVNDFLNPKKMSNLLFVSATKIIKILGIAVLLFCLFLFLNFVVDRAIKKHVSKKKTINLEFKMEPIFETISPLIQSIIKTLLSFVFVVMVLGEFHVNTTSITYILGILSFGLSIASQGFIKDCINSVIILLEGNLGIGEYVKIGESQGTVEKILLRCIYLQHPTGEIQTIPFSDIKDVINYSRTNCISKVTFAIAHDADFSLVEQALNNAFDYIKNNPIHGPSLDGPLQILGVEKFSESASYVLALLQSKPDPLQLLECDFNKKLHSELIKLNVSLPKTIGVVSN
jgi:small-conductance mechanosensitive channel